MDELMISGRRHAASTRVAKQYGYHSDYIGQLIRGNKVKGQKVGRAWYVDIESLAAYLGKEVPAPTPTPESIIESVAEEKETVAFVAVESEAKPQTKATIETATFSADEKEQKGIEQKETVILAKEEAASELESKPEAELVPSREEEYHIPIIKRVEQGLSSEHAPKKNMGLTYVSEDESLLPEIRKNRSASRKLDIEVEMSYPAVGSTKERVVDVEDIPMRASLLKQTVALTAMAALVLALVTAGSSLFVYQLSAGSEQTASIQFSVPQ